MYKRYLYLASQVVFIFCLGCAEVIDSQPPIQAVTTTEAESNVSQMQKMRSQIFGSGEGVERRGMPSGAGPDMSRMQELRSKMYGGGFVAEDVKGLQAMPETPAHEPQEMDESNKLIQRGKKLFEAKKYRLAAFEFEEFLGKYEYGDLVPEALYYLGKIYYQQEKYKDAIMVFKRIDQFYPRYPLAPNAVYRMAKCYEKLDKPQSAQEILKRLNINYPKFDPAKAEDPNNSGFLRSK